MTEETVCAPVPPSTSRPRALPASPMARWCSSKARCRSRWSASTCTARRTTGRRAPSRPSTRSPRSGCAPAARISACTPAPAAAARCSTCTRPRRWPSSSACWRTTSGTWPRCARNPAAPDRGADLGLPLPRAPVGALRAQEGRGAGGLSRAQEPLRGRHARMPGAAAPRRRHADAAARADLQHGRARDLPQIELAGGDDVTALVLRHLEPLSEGDLARCAPLPGAIRRAVVAAAQGPGHGAPAGRRGPPALAYALPEFGITMPFKPTDFTQVNPHINRVLVGRARCACWRCSRVSA
jgi:hypothetical protein